MEQKSLVIGIGELLWDIFPDQKKMGGAPANFAYHVAKLGIESFVISSVGNDDLGDELIKILDKSGLHYDVQRSEYPTGTVQVELNENGIPQYKICEPVAWDFIGGKPEWEIRARNALAVCFGSLAQRGSVSHQSIRQLIKLVSSTSYIVFDINLRQHFYAKQLIHDSLELCNILKINDEEFGIVAKIFELSGSQDELCRAIISIYNLKLLVLTCGTNGSYLYTSTQKSFKETPIIKVIDTVGAGDSFTAAIVVGLVYGMSIEKMHKMAVKLSAFVCTSKGAMPEYSWDKLQCE